MCRARLWPPSWAGRSPRVVVWIVVWALALTLVAAASAAPAAAQRSGTEVRIRGTVLDAVTGDPVADALVFLPHGDRSVRADSAGSFVAEQVPRGLVEIAVAREGYRPLHARLPAMEDREVTLELEPREPDPATGTLEGVVVDATTRRPVSFASVRVLGSDDGDVSDSDGRFRLRWVPGGSAVLAVSHLSYETRVVPQAVTPDSTRQIRVILRERPIPLPGIDVTAQNRWLATGGYYLRQGRGYRGKQWGPEELAALDVGSLDDILREETTLGVRWMGTTRGWEGHRGCEMDIRVDGMSIGETSLDRIDPDRIAAMEVFTGPWWEMPPGYECGVILLWQKRPSDSGRP